MKLCLPVNKKYLILLNPSRTVKYIKKIVSETEGTPSLKWKIKLKHCEVNWRISTRHPLRWGCQPASPGQPALPPSGRESHDCSVTKSKFGSLLSPPAYLGKYWRGTPSLEANRKTSMKCSPAGGGMPLVPGSSGEAQQQANILTIHIMITNNQIVICELQLLYTENNESCNYKCFLFYKFSSLLPNEKNLTLQLWRSFKHYWTITLVLRDKCIKEASILCP